MVANILSVQISDIILPDTFQGNLQPPALPVQHLSSVLLMILIVEGTKTGMLLDCEYNYTKEDRDSLEIKWYFKQVDGSYYNSESEMSKMLK